MALTVTAIKAAKPGKLPYKLFDTQGLSPTCLGALEIGFREPELTHADDTRHACRQFDAVVKHD